ncbi:MAG: hypothetical protein HY738_06680, partial [Bacteroidia bacterium]|nr:hypothetical protein [Bacteroidia bacterium]
NAAAAVVIPDNVSLFRLNNQAGAQANALSVTTPQEGQFLTIINLDNNQATFAGFTIPAAGTGSFVYENTAWRNISLNTGSNPSWLTTGNAGTIDGTNFIGTTDNIPFNFRVNNLKAGRIGIAADGSVFLGYQAGNADDLSDNRNTLIGYTAGDVITTGTYNVAIGYNAMGANTTEGGLVGIGYNA